MARSVFDLTSVDGLDSVLDVTGLTQLFDGFEKDGPTPGQRTKPAQVTRRQAQAVLSEIVRLVADLPRGSSPQVVWTLGANELLCSTDQTQIALDTGVVTISVFVTCDEVPDGARIAVPFGVGTPKRPAGLVMSTFTRLAGPTEITDVWTDAITAFAWESLLELCRTVAGNVGSDNRNRALIPGLVSASRNRLTIQPMARHRVSG